jgi:hypothetical protein
VDIGSRAAEVAALVTVCVATSALGAADARADGAVAAQAQQASSVASDAPGVGSTPPPATDLSRFRSLASDALRLARIGDLRAARARVEELDEAWERSAPTAKMIGPVRWRAVEAAIDRAGRELRFPRARRTDSVEALEALVRVLDSPG